MSIPIEVAPAKKKKKPKTANNEKCLRWMDAMGWKYDKVEQFNSFSFKRHDAFNLWDYEAMGAAEGPILHDGMRKRIIGIQITDANNVAAHRTAMLANPNLAEWKECGGLALLLWGAKVGARWEVRHEWL